MFQSGHNLEFEILRALASDLRMTVRRPDEVAVKGLKIEEDYSYRSASTGSSRAAFHAG